MSPFPSAPTHSALYRVPDTRSQSKDTLTTPATKFGVKVELSDKFIEKVYKLDGLADRVQGLSDAVGGKSLKKTDGSKRATIYGVKKLEDAEWAGTAKSAQCTLILTEGECAGGPAGWRRRPARAARPPRSRMRSTGWLPPWISSS